MFTSDNCDFTAAVRAELNEALATLLADVDPDGFDFDQIEGSYSDLLNNAWYEGVTASELVAAVRR